MACLPDHKAWAAIALRKETVMDLLLLVKSAFVLLTLFFLFYILLDGFDLGIGMSMPFLNEKDKALGAITPFWDGNEVWIVMAVGFLFAVFPALYAAFLPVFYLPLFVVLFAFIIRAVAIEMLYHTPPHASVWRWLLVGSSTMIPLAGALLMATVSFGFSAQDGTIALQKTRTAGILVWLFALGSVGTLVWYGGTYLLNRRIIPAIPAQNRVFGLIAMLLAAAVAVLVCSTNVSGTVSALSLISALILLAGLIVSFAAKAPLVKFFTAGLALAGWLGIAASLLYGKLMALQNLTDTITAPVSSLRIIVPLAAVMMLLILLYTRFVYGIFNRNTLKPEKGA